MGLWDVSASLAEVIARLMWLWHIVSHTGKVGRARIRTRDVMFIAPQNWHSGSSSFIKALRYGFGLTAGSSEFGYLVLSICICNKLLFLTNRFFSTGTVVAALGLPLTTLISRRDLDTVEISHSWSEAILIGPLHSARLGFFWSDRLPQRQLLFCFCMFLQGFQNSFDEWKRMEENQKLSYAS